MGCCASIIGPVVWIQAGVSGLKPAACFASILPTLAGCARPGPTLRLYSGAVSYKAVLAHGTAPLLQPRCGVGSVDATGAGSGAPRHSASSAAIVVATPLNGTPSAAASARTSPLIVVVRRMSTAAISASVRALSDMFYAAGMYGI